MPTIEEIRESEIRELRRVARKQGCNIDSGEYLKEHEKHGPVFVLHGCTAVYGWFDSNGCHRFSIFEP